MFEDTEDGGADVIDGEFDEDARSKGSRRLRKKVGSLCKVLKSLNSQQTKKRVGLQITGIINKTNTTLEATQIRFYKCTF